MVKKIAIIASSALVIAGLLVLLWPPHVEIGVSDRMLSVSLGTPAYAQGSPLTVQPSSKDNFLRQHSPDTNYGAYTYLELRDGAPPLLSRSPLEFDISGLPAGVSIISATLSLNYYLKASTDPVGKTVWAYKLTRTDWVELESTWNIYKTGSNWTAGGGDYVTSNPSGGSTAIPAGYGWMSWNVLAIIQDAYANSKSAEFLVKFETEGLATGFSRAYFYSKEYTDDTSLCPKLIIEYTVAEPEITNTPDTQAFGYLSEGTSSATAIDKFTITNTGNCTVDVTIQGTDLEGGDDVWDLDDNGDPGENIYALWAGLDDGDDLFDTIIKEGKTNIFVIGLIEDGTQDWGMKIYMPLSIPGCDYVEMSATVTLVASEAE